MPEIRDYEVTQTRTVRVSAENEVDAVRIANEAFEGEYADDTCVRLGIEYGRVTRPVRIQNLDCHRDVF